MRITIRPVVMSDIEFLWRMLYYAAQMDRQAHQSPADAQHDPFLRAYVADWGRPTDFGLIACAGDMKLGAVWSRVLEDEQAHSQTSMRAFPEIGCCACLSWARDWEHAP